MEQPHIGTMYESQYYNIKIVNGKSNNEGSSHKYLWEFVLEDGRGGFFHSDERYCLYNCYIIQSSHYMFLPQCNLYNNNPTQVNMSQLYDDPKKIKCVGIPHD